MLLIFIARKVNNNAGVEKIFLIFFLKKIGQFFIYYPIYSQYIVLVFDLHSVTYCLVTHLR